MSVVWNSGSAGYFRFAITQWRQQEFATRYHVGQNIRYGIKVSKSESEIQAIAQKMLIHAHMVHYAIDITLYMYVYVS